MPGTVPPNINTLDDLIFNLEVMRREYGDRKVPKEIVVELYSKLDFEGAPPDDATRMFDLP